MELTDLVQGDRAERMLGGHEEVGVQFAGQDRCRGGCAFGHGGHRIDSLNRGLPENLAYESAYSWDLRAASDEHDLIDAACVDPKVAETLIDRRTRLLDLRPNGPLQ